MQSTKALKKKYMMEIFLGILMVVVAFDISVALKIQQEKHLIKVKEGVVSGVAEESTEGKRFFSFYNIPYAEPPIKDLRFKDPVPKLPWSGRRDGSKKPQKCPAHQDYEDQKTNTQKATVIGNEDCLILNVFTPQLGGSVSRLPVMAYIHGGGYYTGSAFEHEPYVLMNENIVLVTIQYRLSILGFLSTEDEEVPGNFGLKDQQLALEWIKENIAEFGGDTERVTIFGGSAGGASVHFQILSPGSEGLFQRAIMQGGLAICPWSYKADSLKVAREVGDHFNCSLDKGSHIYLECMQSIEARQLVEFAFQSMKWVGYTTSFVPRVDGKFLPERPEVLLKSGKYNKVDIISGNARDEGSMDIMYFSENPLLVTMLRENFSTYGPMSLMMEEEENPSALALQSYQYYLNRTDVTDISENDFPNLVKLYTDRQFRVCQYMNAKILSGDPAVNLYLYEFDHFGSVSDGCDFPSYDRRNWVSHQDSLYYLFGDGGTRFNMPLTHEGDKTVRRFFVSAWTNFATFGNPNEDSLPCNCSWERVSKNDFKYMSITEEPKMKDFNFPQFQTFWSHLKLKQNEILFN